MSHPYIFVYQTICETNGKSYVGVHATNDLNDGYIGCGVKSQSDAARRNMLFRKAVRKYGYASFRRYILSFYDTYKEALEEEKFIVNMKWVKDKSNYNTAIGGEGNTTIWMSDEEKEKWRNNISAGTKSWVERFGRDKMIEIVKKNLKQPKGKAHPFYGKPNNRRRKVIQYSVSGEFVKEHDCIHDAAKYVDTVISNVTLCCQGKYRTCKGYVFKYSNASDVENSKREYNLRYKGGLRSPLIQYDGNGAIIGEYKSILEASRVVGCSKATIEKYLSGKNKTCKGFIFKRA
jgi:hypothetical protein